MPQEKPGSCLSSGVMTIVEVFQKCKEGLGSRLPLIFRRICVINSMSLLLKISLN